MSDAHLFYAIVAGISGCFLGYWILRRWRLARLRRRPFPPEWQQILQKNLPPYRYLSLSLRQQLHDKIKLFLHQKHFIGCAGLQVTDEMRITIAGQACLLLLNRLTNNYRDLRWIYLYPSAFVVERPEMDEAGVVSHGRAGLLGESWSDGKVILSWSDVAEGARDFTDGRNLVLHEFAHQLDHETGATNGAPVLRGGNPAYQTWASVFSQEFARLQQQVSRGEPTLLDAYGASNPAEFFAVATETFFEQPQQMRQRHPELYNELSRYYQLHPADWTLAEHAPTPEETPQETPKA